METIRYFTKDALQCFVYEDRGKDGKSGCQGYHCHDSCDALPRNL